MKTLFPTLVLLIFTVSTINAQNDNYFDWSLRLSGLSVMPVESDGVEGRDLTMSNEFGFEIGLNYFFNKNISTELSLGSSSHETIIQYDDWEQHRYSIGDVRIIPIDLNFQYHFDLNKLKPYVGAGVNYTFFYVEEEMLAGGVNGGKFDNAFGFVLQGGIDYAINDKWYINLDLKKLFLSTEMTTYHGWCGDEFAAKAIVAVPCPDYNVEEIVEKVDINPLSIGLGIGYKW